ncbi:MAG: substrate-binding domain-containing protein [Cyanobacteria bacterium J06621_3]
MVNRKTVSAFTIAALLSCAVPLKSGASSLLAPALGPITLGQTTFSVPASVAEGTEVAISSSSGNISAISDALKAGFETQYQGSKVSIDSKDANAAIQDVLNGNADLAAISRPLTAEEKGKGLLDTTVSRSKIAIVVDQSNPFAQSLTGEQFAKIFRGEIKNWSEVGGPDSEITLVDRPANSETRQALAPYPVFQTAEFKAAANATTLTEDTSEAVAKALGANGIGYVLVDELEANPSLKALSLHQTPPTEAAYPFSRPYSFVYAGGASPAVSAFLGYATGNPGQAVVKAADVSGIGVIPEPVAAASPNSASANAESGEAGAVGDTGGSAAENTDANEAEAEETEGAGAEGALSEEAAAAAGPDGVLGTEDDIASIDPAGPDGVLGTEDDIEVLNSTAGPDGIAGTEDDIEIPGEEAAGAGLESLAGRGSWWWLLLPLAGLGLLIWAAGKRGSEEDTGYSVNTGRDNIDSNYDRGDFDGEGRVGLGGLDANLTTAGKTAGAGLGKMAAGGAAIAGGVAAAGAGLADRAKDVSGSGMTSVRGGVSGTASSLEGSLQDGIEGTKTNIQGGIDGAKTTIQGGIDGVKDNVQGGIDSVKGGLSGGVSGLSENVREGVDGVKDNVQGGIDSVKGGIQSGIESAKADGDSWLDRAKQRINEATEQVKDTAGDIKDDITNDQ